MTLQNSGSFRWKKVYLFAFVCALPTALPAQDKQVAEQRQVWAGYFNQTRFSDKWGLWADAHLRTKEDFVNNLSQALLRVGITYYLNNDAKLTAGYAFINHFPADNHRNVSQPEHRPWQQLQWHSRWPRLRLMQWLRLEERYRRRIKNDNELADGFNFNFRTRYNLLAQFALGPNPFAPRTVSAVVSNEVFLNFGKQITYNTFDQNRAFVGLAFYVNNHDNLQVGYMNVWQQLAAGRNYRSLHTARVFFFHNLDLRKGRR